VFRIPLCKRIEGVCELLRRVRGTLDELPRGAHEIVVVDYGSSDRVFDLLTAAADEDPRIVAISLSRNFGHQGALTVALDKFTEMP
jgi:glycosyltransferase involved in cell wall biosynthesis